jgi:hypothetical protein
VIAEDLVSKRSVVCAVSQGIEARRRQAGALEPLARYPPKGADELLRTPRLRTSNDLAQVLVPYDMQSAA